MRKSQISASMMCSNLVDLQAAIDVFEKEKVEYLHIDVMDGEFVPNFGLGVDYIRGLRELTSIPLDLHLMIKDPEYKLPWIGIHKEDIVTIHYESTFQDAPLTAKSLPLTTITPPITIKRRHFHTGISLISPSS